eukprot:11172125-Lingulodinium_polyedra.AAC.1
MPRRGLGVCVGGNATGLAAQDAGVADQELAARALETAVAFDQLQVAEIAAVEIASRKAQLCELKRRGRVVVGEFKGVTDDDFL